MKPATEIAPSRTDRETVEAFLRNLRDEGEVFEIRAINYSDHPDGQYASTVSGFFNDPPAAARAVESFARRGTCEGWYVTLNPVGAELLALAKNRLKSKAKTTAADKDVVARTRLLIDVDPVRKGGISSTDAELARAQQVADEVAAFLAARGWADPIRTMSGTAPG